jgi:D-aminoacyl-tRNA deacylase
LRALLQRVSNARVSSEGTVLGEIGPGLLVLLGVSHSDDEATAAKLAAKVARLRIFADAAGKMNRSLVDTGCEALVVSQFTLYGDARSGNRPSYIGAARPEQAAPLCEEFVRVLAGMGPRVATGEFGAHMAVELLNDGPVTIWLDSEEL